VVIITQPENESKLLTAAAEFSPVSEDASAAAVLLPTYRCGRTVTRAFADIPPAGAILSGPHWPGCVCEDREELRRQVRRSLAKRSNSSLRRKRFRKPTVVEAK
jgi:hypothetical protein